MLIPFQRKGTTKNLMFKAKKSNIQRNLISKSQLNIRFSLYESCAGLYVILKFSYNPAIN